MVVQDTFYSDPAKWLARELPDEPVFFYDPERLTRMARRFIDGFPGEVTNAVKANPDPVVIEVLSRAGLQAFDVASPEEMALVRDVDPKARLHYHNPVRSRAEVAAARDFGVVSWSVDRMSELDKLGDIEGAEIAVLDFADRRSKAFKEAETEARAAGMTPLLRSAYEQATSLVNAVRNHPAAKALLDMDGPTEQAFIWHDLCWRRSKIDKWVEQNGRPIIVDIKTAQDASPDGFMRSSAPHGYFQQDCFYRDAARALLGHPDPAFVFIVTEKEPPHVTGVYELTAPYRAIGDHLNEIAVARFMHGQATGEWPGYSNDIERISAPRWLEIAHEERLDREAEGGKAA